MSEENVSELRRGLEHFIATGEPEWDLLAPDVEVRDHDIPDAGEYRGHSGYARWLADWAAAWGEFTLDPEEYIDAGDRVIVVLRMRATGAGSGVTVERTDAMVCEMRDLKVTRLDYYNNRERALRSAGVEPEAGS
jgi:ketosteroid isomerase-like protein